MSNISTTHSSLAHHISNRIGNVSIVGSSVKDSEDVLIGGLVPRMSLATSFFVANTTISKCFTNAVNTTENNPSMVHETLSASHTFINCTWTSTTTSAHGGAIFSNKMGSLTILSCSFIKCNATTASLSQGGAIRFLGNSAFSLCVNNSKFISCYSQHYTGSLSCTQPSTLIMTRTNFSKSTSGLSVPTAHLLHSPDGSILSNLRFEDGKVDHDDGNSGAIDFDRILGSITQSNILFNSNTAGKGGAVLYSFTSGKPDISWFSCIFFNNKARVERPISDDITNLCLTANDLHFHRDTDDWNHTLAREGSFRNCFSNSEFPRITINTGSTNTHNTISFTNNTLLSDLFPNPSLIVSVRDGATDGDGCGMNYFLPCKTLGYAGKNQLQSSTGEVLVEAGLFEETMGFVVTTRSVTITSYGNENPVFDLSSVGETFMTISNGFDANLKYLSFIVAGNPVVQHTGTGNVDMESCVLMGDENRIPTTSDLISTSGSLSVRNTIFSSLNVGSGVVLKWDGLSSVSLTDLFFLNLETGQAAPFTITPAATLSLSGLYFEKCIGGSFSDLEVDQSALSQLPAIDSWLSTSTSPRTSLKGGEQLTLWPSYQMVVDGNEGADEAFCWLITKKCQTLSNLVTRLGSNLEGTILVRKGRTNEAMIVLVDSQKFTVSGESRTESIFDLESSSTSLIVVPSASSLSLSSLTLTLPSSHTSSPVISSSGTFALSSVTFTLSSSHSDLSVEILSVTSGTTSLVSCSFDGEKKPIGSFLSQSGGTVTLEACSMSEMKMKKSFVSGSGIVFMKGCSFSSLVDDCSSGSGNVIEMQIGEGQKLEISKTATHSSSFISCSSKGNGGALNIAVIGTGTLTISDTSFASCSAAGNGGALFVDLSASTSTSTSFSSLVFGSGSDVNRAALGTKVFVQSSNLKTDADGVLIGLKPTLSGSLVTITEKNEYVGHNTSPESLLFFWYPHIDSSGAVHVHTLGEDHANCGLFALACQTLTHSFTSLKTPRTITLDSPLQVPSSLPTLTEPLTISALAGSPQTLTLASGVCFTVSSGTLSFASLSIELAQLSSTVFVVAGGSIVMDSTCRLVNPSSATHSASLFSISSGTLTLANTPIDFSNRFMSSQSLFSQTGGSLALSGMSIENVSRSSGDGSVISSKLSSGSLSITSCSFSSCICSNGNGGAITVKLVSGSLILSSVSFKSCSADGHGGVLFLDITEMKSSATLSFQSLTFGTQADNDACSADQMGQNVFLLLPPNVNEATLNHLKPLIPTQPLDEIAFNKTEREFVEFGKKTDSSFTPIGSLLYLVHPPSDSIRVRDVNGFDHELCGNGLLPCLTLEGGYSRLGSGNAFDTLTLNSNLRLGTQFESRDKDAVIKADSTEKMIIEEEGCFVIPIGKLTFANIELSLTSTISTSPFQVTGGELCLSASAALFHPGSAATPTKLSSPVFTVTKGSLTIDGSSDTPRVFSFFSNTEGIDGCVIRVGGDLSTQAKLQLSNCHFTSCSNTQGAIISFTGSVPGLVSLDACFFTNNEGFNSNDVSATECWCTALTKETIKSSFSESSLHHLTIGSSSADDILPFSILGVKGRVQDDDNCGLPGISCTSVSKALTHCTQEKDNVFALRTIQMEDDTKESSTLAVGSRQIALTAVSVTTQLEWASDASMITVTTGSVSLESFTLVDLAAASTVPLMFLSSTGTLSLSAITFSGGHFTFHHSLIQSTAGQVILSFCVFSDIGLDSHALFETVSAVEMNTCQFSSITRHSEGPTILSAALSADHPVTALGTAFTACASDGVDSWISFTGQNAKTFDPSNWLGTFDLFSPRTGVVVDNETKVGDATLSPYSLVYEMYPASTQKVFVSSQSGNLDHPLCGHSMLRCRTIDGSHDLTKVDTIEVVGTGNVEGVLVVGNATVTLNGHNGHGTLAMVGLGQVVSDDADDPGMLIVSSLVVDVSLSTLSGKTVFDIVTGTMEISSSSLVSSKSVGLCLISFSGTKLTISHTSISLNISESGVLLTASHGLVNLDTVNISSSSFASTPIVLSDVSSVTMTSLDMADCSVSELISVTNTPSLTLSQSDFVGSSSAVQSTSNSDLCSWSSGLVSLTNCTTVSVIGAVFSSLPQGALFISNSTIRIASSSFSLNKPSSSSSVHWNIRCEGLSKLEIESLNGGDGSQTPSHWISTDEDCVVTKEQVNLEPSFFNPVFSKNESKCVFNKKSKTYSVSLVGQNLIPCGLFLELFEKTPKSDGKTHPIELIEGKTSELAEKRIDLVFKETDPGFNATFEWRGQLVYGRTSKSDSFLIKQSSADERKALTIQTMIWLGPLIGGLLALFLLFLIILLIVRKRRKEKKSEPLKKSELQEIDLAEIVIKEDFPDQNFFVGQSTLTGFDTTSDIPVSDITDNTILQPDMPSRGKVENNGEEVMDAIAFNDCMTTTKKKRADSLYTRLHGENRPDLDRKRLRLELARGIGRLSQLDPRAPELTALSPHSIFLDVSGNIFFKTASQNDHGAFFGSNPASRSEQPKAGLVDQRWQAPETQLTNQNVNREKAAVFSLGLLLWEIETGEVPLKELDAANAQRVLGQGVQLAMENVKSTELADIIIRCIHHTPSERPTPFEVVKVLEEADK
ncbi:hypothetical protein BLNAU_20645 [Blattamonas nauphoetae]|uniref:Protein kinase domain-containing protein n=1 Tax=Blattamonas nauphoetae TaxID=2049346 RepID=A0ABQ9X1E1_9EUKA|nr:hypothetical protein BLNAU_20645 [Blattamonas nauphoetae]